MGALDTMMNNITTFVGIGWGDLPTKKKGFDGKNKKRPLKLEERVDLGKYIRRAVASTAKKFGKTPEVVYLSDAWFATAPKFVDGIPVILKKLCQPHLIMCGWEVPLAEAREFERALHRGDFKK